MIICFIIKHTLSIIHVLLYLHNFLKYDDSETFDNPGRTMENDFFLHVKFKYFLSLQIRVNFRRRWRMIFPINFKFKGWIVKFIEVLLSSPETTTLPLENHLGRV